MSDDKRRRALDELTRINEELGLGYDPPAAQPADVKRLKKRIDELVDAATDMSEAAYSALRADLFAEIERLVREAHEANDWSALRKRRDEAERALAEAQADAKRLDFIASKARCDPKMDGQHVWWPTTFNNALRGPNLRAAIDAAMKEGQ